MGIIAAVSIIFFEQLEYKSCDKSNIHYYYQKYQHLLVIMLFY